MKTTRFFLTLWTAALVSCLLAMVTPAAHAAPAAITELRMVPLSIDVGFAAPSVQYITVSVRVVDPTGFKGGVFTLLPQAGYGKSVYFDSASRRPGGSAADGIYDFTIAVWQYSTTGMWAASAQLYDLKGQLTTLTSDQLQANGLDWYVSVTGGPDVAPPVLVGLDFTPKNVDTTDGPQTVMVQVKVSDVESGFHHGVFRFIAPPCSREPDGESKGAVFDSRTLVPGSGDLKNGTYEFPVTLPQDEVYGPWSVEIYLQDNKGNNITMDSAGVAGKGYPAFLQVIGGGCAPDVPPTLPTGSLKIVAACTSHFLPHGEPGVLLTLVGPDGSTRQVSTGEDGIYSDTALPVGTYTITAPLSSRDQYGNVLNTASTPAVQTVTIRADALTEAKFAYVGATILGKLFWDKNYNADPVSPESETTDVALGGIDVTLADQYGAVAGITTTDPDGSYAFDVCVTCLNAGIFTLQTPTSVTSAVTDNRKVLAVTSSRTNTVAAGGAWIANFPYQSPLVSLGDRVWKDANGNGVQDTGEAGINGVTVRLYDAGGNSITSTTTSGDGNYLFRNLKPDTFYRIVIDPSTLPSGIVQTYDLDGLATSNSIMMLLSRDETQNAADFGYKPAPPPPSGPFTTYTQGGWGAKPSGNNPGALLARNFTPVFPQGVSIGGTYFLQFTSASAVQGFLPQGGTAGRLTASAVNPTRSSAGVFAGQLLAATLSVGFSNAGITRAGLAGLTVQSGPLAGYTVSQVLQVCNKVIGGGSLPPGVSLSDLNNTLDNINQNFDNGTSNKGYLK